MNAYAQLRLIISSSGMCDSGSIVNYLNSMEKDSKNTIMLCGFQTQGTRGAQLAALANNPEEKSKRGIFADIVNMSSYYSGHADQTVLLDYIFNLSDYKSATTQAVSLFLNHGNKQSKIDFLNAINHRNIQKLEKDRVVDNVLIAGENKDYEWFDLESNQFSKEGAPITLPPQTNGNVLQEILNELKALNSKLTKMQGEPSLEG